MTFTQATAILCTGLLTAQNPYIYAQQAQPGVAPQAPTQKTYSPEQLDSLVAPIALYPDPVVGQVLVASTYPMEVVEAGRWLKQNSNLKDQALADAAKQQNWDASVQALVALPDMLNRLDQNLSWTTDLGNAVLAQQADVMAAIQRMREKASNTGALYSTPQQTVTTQTENGQTYIVIQPASTQVISIPQYNPEAVYGPPPEYYPYPPLYYPPYSPGAYAAASAISFGLGMAVGAFWGGGGGWGWGCGWGGGHINVNNNFISVNHFNRASIGNGNRWQHNPAFGGGNNRGGLGNVATRPNAGQIQQRLGQGGVANRMQGNSGQRGNLAEGNRGQRGNLGQGNRGQRGNLGQGGAGVGSADRMTGGRMGGAERSTSGNFGQAGGGNRTGNRSFAGGGGSRAGGGSFRPTSGGSRGGGGSFRGGGGGSRGGGGRRRG
jgi:Protein of unknown function (DUF3300)